ncbi:hypothetical protein VTG60DRAFT_1466 [Thermothelomyces hinnuleus]
MAPIIVSEPPLPSYGASAHTSGSDYDCIQGLTPTRQSTRPTCPSVTHVERFKIDSQHVTQSSLPDAPLDGPGGEAGRFLSPKGSSCRRINTGDSTILSKDHSVATSRNESGTDSDDDGCYHSPREASKSPPPPPPPPPRHPPAAHNGGPLPIQGLRRQDPGSSESESSASDEATRSLNRGGGRPSELRRMIEAKRRSIRLLRRRMADKRLEMRELRRRMDDIDNALMQIIRPRLASKAAVVPADVLMARFKEMQKIRDVYYTAEDAYEDMEFDLATEEAALERLEDQPPRSPPNGLDAVPKPPATVPPPPPTMKTSGIVVFNELGDSSDDDANSSGPPTPVTLFGISGQLHDDVHPLYEELLEAAGERQLAKEHVEDLEMHRDKILYNLEIQLHRKRVRENRGNQISEEDLLSLRSSLAQVPSDAAEFEQRFGISITGDELEFLRSYQDVQDRALLELDSATETLDRLRFLCQKKGVMRKHPSYHEEVAIYSSFPDWSPSPQDGNMAIEPLPMPPPNPPDLTRTNATSAASLSNTPTATTTTATNAAAPPSLAHPRFPVLLSNPSHVLALLSPLQALERALRLPKDDPSSALRRAECMKELGISTLMTKAENKADYINQWLIHRLRTSPLEAELLLAICEGTFRVVNLRRWQEEVLYYWRLDEAAISPAGWASSGVEQEQEKGGRPPAADQGRRRSKTSWKDQQQQQHPLVGGAVGPAPLPMDQDNAACSVAGNREGNSVILEEGKVRSDGGLGMLGSPGLREGRTRSVKSFG